ncbi:hypothetical protein [Streptomyces lasiicapitis]|uniref:hypothetical protein n=1 Tax=Streptomyces lasiicapitis TaxID=1923961 RepID=UPI0036C48F87
MSKDNEQHSPRRGKSNGAARQSTTAPALDPTSPQGKLVTGILQLVEEHETSLHAAREQERERAALAREVADGPELDKNELTLADVGRIRRAYKTAEEATVRVIIQAHEREERSATEIARELDMSPSYVSRVIREHKAAAGK